MKSFPHISVNELKLDSLRAIKIKEQLIKGDHFVELMVLSYNLNILDLFSLFTFPRQTFINASPVINPVR